MDGFIWLHIYKSLLEYTFNFLLKSKKVQIVNRNSNLILKLIDILVNITLLCFVSIDYTGLYYIDRP